MTSSLYRLRRTASILGAALLVACTGAAQAAPYVIFRDPGCGCCKEWAAHARHGLEHEVQVRDDEPMDSVKARLGVPADLASCHTALVEGYVIEGHVPAREIKRLLAEKPVGVKGLAVAGMPMGSPGMDAGGRVQAYQVIAFGDGGRKVFASFP